MLFSSAYATVMGLIPPLVTDKTAVISDELNHNCIINAIALARPAEKRIYKHLDIGDLERQLEAVSKTCARAIVVTDGIFSMRGDYAPLDRIMALARAHDRAFAENAIVVVDDFARRRRIRQDRPRHRGIYRLQSGRPLGRDTRQGIRRQRRLRCRGRDRHPLPARDVAVYIYSNPITPAEAAAAHTAIDILDSPAGLSLLTHLRAMTARFKAGLVKHGLETLPGEHPVVPLMLRDTARTRRWSRICAAKASSLPA